MRSIQACGRQVQASELAKGDRVITRSDHQALASPPRSDHQALDSHILSGHQALANLTLATAPVKVVLLHTPQ